MEQMYITSGLEYLPRNSLFGEEVHWFRRGGAVNRICELTRFVVDLLDAQVPDPASLCAARSIVPKANNVV
jgi:hypothetical protein